MKKIIIILLGLCISLGITSVASASLWSFWQETGQNYIPCNQERAELAAEYAVWNYDCSEEKNNLLEKRLKDDWQNKNDQFLGYSVVTRYKTTLASSMTSNQTTIPVASITTFDGHPLTMSDLGNVVFLTLEPGRSNEEIIKCTGISGTNWTGCTRGLAFYGTKETAVTANQKAHNAGSIVVMSNVHYVYEQLTDKDTSEVVNGSWIWTSNTSSIFYVFPTVSSTGYTGLPTENGYLATKYYVDTVGAGGFTSVNVSSTRGLEALGTSPETVGVNVSSTKGMYQGSDGQGIYQMASTTKNLNQDSNGIYLEGDDAFTWTGEQTFSATTTMTTTTIAEATITSSSITNLNLDGENANPLVDGSSTTIHYHSSNSGVYTGTTANNTTPFNIAHGLGTVPKKIRLNTAANWTTPDGIGLTGYGIVTDINGTQATTTQDFVYLQIDNNASGPGTSSFATNVKEDYIVWFPEESFGFKITSFDSTNITITPEADGGLSIPYKIIFEVEN